MDAAADHVDTGVQMGLHSLASGANDVTTRVWFRWAVPLQGNAAAGGWKRGA